MCLKSNTAHRCNQAPLCWHFKTVKVFFLREATYAVKRAAAEQQSPAVAQLKHHTARKNFSLQKGFALPYFAGGHHFQALKRHREKSSRPNSCWQIAFPCAQHTSRGSGAPHVIVRSMIPPGTTWEAPRACLYTNTDMWPLHCQSAWKLHDIFSTSTLITILLLCPPNRSIHSVQS